MPRSTMLVRAVLLCAALAAADAAAAVPRLNKEQTPLCKSRDGLAKLAAQLGSAPADKVAAAAGLFLWGAVLPPMAGSALTTGINVGAVNALFNNKQLITPQSQFIYNIVASNSDTLYSVGWLDLSGGPVVLTAGDSAGRFYTLELLDFYTEVFGNPGAATTGTKASKFVVTRCGEDRATLPPTLQSGVTAYYCSNTNLVWVIGRTFVAGEKDLPAAQAVQASVKVAPLDAQGKALAAKSASTTQAAATINASMALLKQADWSINGVSDAAPMFAAMLGLAKAFPPLSDTSAPLKAAPQLGLDPAKGFNQPPLTAEQQQVLTAGWRVGQACIDAYTDLTIGGKALKYGWGYMNVVGNYNDNFLARAVAAYVGLGANWLNVTIYPTTQVDADGVPLTGANGNIYTWTIDEASLPPTKFFSSLIIYNSTNKMIPVVPNAPRWRFNFPADKGQLAKNADGSVTLWLSHAPPGPPGSAKYTNWLPLSDGPSWAMLRMYGPSPSAVAGGYQPPPIVKVAPAGVSKDSASADKQAGGKKP